MARNYIDARTGGVFEIALPFHADAYRVIYAVQLSEEIWVVHAFRKKSTKGVKTPKREIDLKWCEGVAMCSASFGTRTRISSSSRLSWPPKSLRRSIGRA
jgi:Phage derived protein Gp49-like (DUF891)